MSLIQKWETRLFKMPHLETPRFQTGASVTIASGHTLDLLSEATLKYPRSHLETRRFQMRHFEKPRFPCF